MCLVCLGGESKQHREGLEKRVAGGKKANKGYVMDRLPVDKWGSVCRNPRETVERVSHGPTGAGKLRIYPPTVIPQ